MASSLEWAIIKNEPLGAPPPGITPNFANPPSTAFKLRIAAAICIPLAVMFGALRLYARVLILKKWTWDDGEQRTCPSENFAKVVGSDVCAWLGRIHDLTEN